MRLFRWPDDFNTPRWDWVDNWRPKRFSRAERRHGRRGRNFRRKWGVRSARALSSYTGTYIRERLEERSFMSQIFNPKKLPTAIQVMGEAINDSR
jgi:hypothetical protein